MDRAAFAQILTSYSVRGSTCGRAPAGANEARNGELHFQLHSANGKEYVAIHAGGRSDYRVFLPCDSADDLKAYLGPAPTAAIKAKN